MKKVGSQETPEITGKFGLGMQNEAGQRLIDFCQENALVRANWRRIMETGMEEGDKMSSRRRGQRMHWS